MVNGVEEEIYSKVLLGGPTRVGKSTLLDTLESLRPNIERGGKYKWRFLGGPWPEDGQNKDSVPLFTLEEVNQLRKEGKVVRDGKTVIEDKIAFEYTTRDTLHLVGSTDAQRTDKHIVYISDDHRGAMAFKQHFKDSIIPFLLYTRPELIEARLRTSKILDEQIRIRLQTFEAEFALFQQHIPEYLFLISIQYPPIDRSIVLDKATLAKKKIEVMYEATRVFALIDAYKLYHRPGMSYADVHTAHVNEKSQKLVGSDLTDLEGKLREGEEVKVDLSEQKQEYLRTRHFVPKEVISALDNVVVHQYFYDNGRHSILLKGIVDPLNEPYYGPEDVILDLIIKKLGEPTQKRNIKSQNYSPNHSDFGLFRTAPGYGALFKDGVVYSLGDQLVDLVHTSINIGFLYSRGQKVSLVGDSAEDIQKRGISNGTIPVIF